MHKAIDCLIVGHNEMDFREYEKAVRQMGTNSGAYRDLNLNFLRYNNKPYQPTEVFNLFCGDDRDAKISLKPIDMLDTFSATIAYLGTYLDRRGFTFDYIHSFQEEKAAFREKLMRGNILTIAITTTLYVAALPILEIINFIREYNHTVRIIVGGPFVSTQARLLDKSQLEYLFKSTIGADFYVNSHQGEAALVQIINALKNNLPLENIANIYYKTDKNYVSTSVSRESNRITDNMVNWHLFSDKPRAQVMVRTSMSCPFSCAFCGYPEHAGSYQVADVSAVERELDSLARIGSVRSVYFIDDTFNIPTDRFKTILRMLLKNRYDFKWHSYFRCQFADREMVELMKESGCEGVFLGIESGNNHILQNMNKAARVEKYLEGIALLKEYDIVTHGNFIIGFPGETRETVRDTVEFIEASGLDFFRAQLWFCEAITPIWKERGKYNIEGERFEWRHATMDSRAAADLIDDIFLSVKKPLWLPQYNFNFDSLWHLIHQGLSLEMVKNFLQAFNRGIQEKLTGTSRGEVSYEVICRLKNFHRTGTHPDGISEPYKNISNHADAEFSF
jgi:anaerobic magnesium-protoporphyrin IX monomethyl ester cyclase